MIHSIHFYFGLLLTVALMACPQTKENQTSQSVLPVQNSVPKENQAQKKTTVLFLGDSLTAGFRLARKEAFPALLQEFWLQQKKNWRTRNSGISGDTSSGLLRRLNWNLTSDVHTVFLCIGANDGLRGQPLVLLKKNMEQIIQIIQKKNIRLVLAGMQIPSNYGEKYTLAFSQLFPWLAQKYKLPFYPFLLEKVAGKKDLNLEDGIHPNAKGHRIISRLLGDFFEKKKIF